MSSQYTTLAAFYVAVTRLLDGEDVTISDVSVPTLEEIFPVAQKRIYRDVRSRFNEKAFSALTTTSNLASLPADFKDLSIVHLGKQALVPVDEAVIRDYWNQSPTGFDKYVARAGNSLTFWPPVADGTTVSGRYFFAYDNLTDANMAANLLFQEADDLFLYACLVEAAPFFDAGDRMETWQQKYLSIATDLNKLTHRATYAKRLQVRSSASLCGVHA